MARFYRDGFTLENIGGPDADWGEFWFTSAMRPAAFSVYRLVSPAKFDPRVAV